MPNCPTCGWPMREDIDEGDDGDRRSYRTVYYCPHCDAVEPEPESVGETGAEEPADD